MATNEFQPWATGGGANVLSEAAYLAYAARTLGFQAGIAPSNACNKIWRQASLGSYLLGQFMFVYGQDALDDGNLANLLASFRTALILHSVVKSARIVSSSTPVAVGPSDYAIGLSRTLAPAATNVLLPPHANIQVGAEFEIADLAGNAGAFPITVIPNAGVIGNLANYALNENLQVARFRYFGNDQWSVDV